MEDQFAELRRGMAEGNWRALVSQGHRRPPSLPADHKNGSASHTDDLSKNCKRMADGGIQHCELLTGENPVPEEAKGQPPLNREAWLEWGRRNGYLQI